MLGKPTLKPKLEQSSHRVYRGGSWGVDPQSARVTNRSVGDPDDRLYYLGFRLVRPSNHEGEQHEKEG